MIEFEMKELAPWADIHRILANASSLTVVAGGVAYTARGKLEIDDRNNVTLTCFEPSRELRAKRGQRIGRGVRK